MELKPDKTIKRLPDRKGRKPPKKPLSQKEKEYLLEHCWEFCRNAYVKRMYNSGLYSDYESKEDLEAESFIAMKNMLEKFDKSQCGEIQEYDEEGAKKPKTLDFYFKNFFSQRVNFAACESITDRNKRTNGRKYSDKVFDVEYDEESNEFYDDSKIPVFVEKILKDKNYLFKRFYVQKFLLEITDKELREEFQNYNELMNEVEKLHNEVRETVKKEEIEVEKVESNIKSKEDES